MMKRGSGHLPGGLLGRLLGGLLGRHLCRRVRRLCVGQRAAGNSRATEPLYSQYFCPLCRHQDPNR